MADSTRTGGRGRHRNLFLLSHPVRPAALANYAILGFVLGRGEGALGLLLQTIINGTNIVLSILLGLMLGWGVAGVAVGTVAGEVIGAILGFMIVYRRFDRRDAPGRATIFAADRLKALFGLNRDIMIRSFVLLAAFTLMTRIGTSLGPVTLAANAVLMNIFLVAAIISTVWPMRPSNSPDGRSARPIARLSTVHCG